MALLLRRVGLSLLTLGVLLGLAACRPSYSRQGILDTIRAEIRQDWSIEVDQIRLENGHLGLIYQTDAMPFEQTDQGVDLTEQAKRQLNDLARTVERVLTSSDVQLERFSVTMASARATHNIKVEIPWEIMRKLRTGQTSQQALADIGVMELMPGWRWSAFDEPYAYWHDLSDQDMQSELERLIKQEQQLDVFVRINGNTLAVLHRMANVEEGNGLTPEASQNLLTLTRQAGAFALRTDRDFAYVNVTLMGEDAKVNHNLISPLERVASMLTGELTAEQFLAELQPGMSPFWEWVGIGRINLYNREGLLERVSQLSQIHLDGRPDAGISDQSLVVQFGVSALPTASALQGNEPILNLLDDLERAALLAEPRPVLIYLVVSTPEGDSRCLLRNQNDTLAYFTGELDQQALFDRLVVLDQCPVLNESAT